MKIPFRLRSSKTVSAFVVCLFVLTSCDFYPENGKWEGPVQIRESLGQEAYGCPLSVEISRTHDAVSVRSFDLYCGSRSVHWSPDVYSRRGTDLFQDERKVGDIYPDGTVRLELKDPYFNDRYPNRVGKLVITWSRLGNSLHFSLREESEAQTRTIEGTLSFVR